MSRFAQSLAAGITCSCLAAPTVAQSPPREPTDIHIRRLAGLAPETARGQIQIIDIGHDPMSTMLSIVANRTDAGWQVSYACAASPRCAPGADHAARTYILSKRASAEVDQLIAKLRNGGEPDGQLPSTDLVGGHLAVRIDYQGFQREYRRTGLWGHTLGRLEALLTDTAK